MDFSKKRKLQFTLVDSYTNSTGRNGFRMNNSFAAVHPELVSEWSNRNLPLTPDHVTYGSNKLYWWKGKCGHEWQASAKSRSTGEKCPICSGARVVSGINNLATLKPKLAAEWSATVKSRKINGTVLITLFWRATITFRQFFRR